MVMEHYLKILIKKNLKKWIIKCENHGFYDVDNVEESYIEGVIIFINDEEEYEIPFYYSCSYIDKDKNTYGLVAQKDLFFLYK